VCVGCDCVCVCVWVGVCVWVASVCVLCGLRLCVSVRVGCDSVCVSGLQLRVCVCV
jgi:hypothetical protein